MSRIYIDGKAGPCGPFFYVIMTNFFDERPQNHIFDKV